MCEHFFLLSTTIDVSVSITVLLTKTRQVTAAALYKVQMEAYSSSDDSQNISYEAWKINMIEKSPTFQFWDTVLDMQKKVLTFIRAHRERNFDLYVQSLDLDFFLHWTTTIILAGCQFTFVI